MLQNIPIAADHAGFELKQQLIQHFQQRIHFVDMGTHSAASMDYPDIVHPLCNEIEHGTYTTGVLICGSAQGVAITANKHPAIRAAICWQTEIAQLARMHNNANVLCLPARFLSLEQAIEIIETFINTAFEGGRHQNRVNKICI